MAYKPSKHQPAALVGLLPIVETSERHTAGAFRSPLRDGTELDNLNPNRPFTTTLFSRSDLPPILPPTPSSEAYLRCDRIVKQLRDMRSKAACTPALDLPKIMAEKFAPYFGLKRSGTFGPKLAKHRLDDPIDPVNIFKEAMPLVHLVLTRDPHGDQGHDLDGMAYIIDRLTDAQRLKGQEIDIRFAALEALSDFLLAVLAKVAQEELA